MLPIGVKVVPHISKIIKNKMVHFPAVFSMWAKLATGEG